MQKLGVFGAKTLFFLLPFMGLLLTRLRFENDLWFMLNSGRYVLENGFPYTEPFSMHEGLNFVLEQWLTDIIYWEIYTNFGAEAVMTFVLVTGFFILMLYEKTCLFLSNNIALSKILTLIFGIITMPIFLLSRPQILSTLIFLAEVYFLLNYTRTNNRKYLLTIPIFSLLIVNLHCALWPMIFILILPFVATFLARKTINIDEKYLGEQFDLKPILFISVMSFFIAFINPYGFEAMTFLFVSYDPNIHGRIPECQPMFLNTHWHSFFFVYLFAGIILLSRVKMPIYLILLFAGLGLLGLLAQRNVFWFNTISTIIFAYGFKEYKFEIHKINFNFLRLLPFLFIDVYLIYTLVNQNIFSSTHIVLKIYVVAILIALILFSICYRIDDNILKIKNLFAAIVPFFIIAHIPFQYVYSAEDFIDEKYKTSIDIILNKNNPEDVVLFTGSNTGSYPEFRGIKCYLDGRAEVFSPSNSGKDFSIIGEYFDVCRGKIFYRDFVKKYNFNYMLIEPDDGVLFVMLPHDDDFDLLHEEKNLAGNVYSRLYRVKQEKFNAKNW